jgi:D-alanyl-D-alanine carboxypeptidase/D-alanyl-D-alanine-endopeptidase (penicillin-binding protein 4)
MQRMFTLILAVALACSPAGAAKKTKRPAKVPLAQRIGQLVNGGEAARAYWGIDVVSLTSGKTVYGLNEQRLFTPASNAKLFTTVSAMALLGPEYKTRTTVESNAAPDSDGRITGDLTLVGRGDANLSGRVLPYNQKTERTTPSLRPLESLADQVVSHGVKVISGDVVGDDRWFTWERYGAGWAWDDLMWDYGAPASALTVNDNVMYVTVLPGPSIGDKATLRFEPENSYYEIDNRITTVAAGTGPKKIGMDRQPGSKVITLWGTVPMDDVPDSDALAIDDPAGFAAQAFKAMLEKRGVKITGKVLSAHAPPYTVEPKQETLALGGGEMKPVPLKTTVLANYESAPLLEDLTVVNKVSQNLHAELTLREIGREKAGVGSIASGLAEEQAVFAAAGIKPEEYALFDGSGLSRATLVTPHALLSLLVFADKQPWAAEFRSTLPVGGVDGTLAERFKGTPAEGHVFAKTGTLSHVNALSGYLDTTAGERLAFSIICANHKLTSRGATHIMDAIVQALMEKPAEKPGKTKLIH